MITEIYIKEIADSLKHLLKDVVFVGGAVVNLYSTDSVFLFITFWYFLSFLHASRRNLYSYNHLYSSL